MRLGKFALKLPNLRDGAHRHRVALTLTAILAITIAYLTLTPQSLPVVSGGDKLHHVIGFAALSLPAATLYRRALIWLLPSAIAFGGIIEIIQPYVNRQGEWADFGADAIGAILGVSLGLFLRYIFRNRFTSG